MITIEPGVELDRAVAEAIGLIYEKRPSPNYHDYSILGSKLEGWWRGEGYVGYTAPRYSKDLNAAFAAAEWVSDHIHLTKNSCTDGQWECGLVAGIPSRDYVLAETPALAICTAILKLKEVDHGRQTDSGRGRSDQQA